MFQIQDQEMSPEFFKCWKAAGMHLDTCVDGGIQTWLRAHPYPPFLEHLSFRLGNQLFFIRIEDEERKIYGPGNSHGLHHIAEKSNGHACLLRMKKDPATGSWTPFADGWGLIDAKTRIPIDPTKLVTDEKIEMTFWERQDMAVLVVRNYIEKEGYKLMSWQSNPEVDPSIWFIGKSDGPEWIVVRETRFPENEAPRPDNWNAIVEQCARMSRIGHFASVALVNSDQEDYEKSKPAVPLWRGCGMYVSFQGLS